VALRHRERHSADRICWLRAAVLGGNDGIGSTASLMLGVAAAAATYSNVMVAGIAGLVAGTMSMAAGKYVSVRSQADSEQAPLNLEGAELAADDQGERQELTAIYVSRGVDLALAKQVADQLMPHDALGAHAHDELGISETLRARPIQAALAPRPASPLWGSHAAVAAAVVGSVSLTARMMGAHKKPKTLPIRCVGALTAKSPRRLPDPAPQPFNPPTTRQPSPSTARVCASALTPPCLEGHAAFPLQPREFWLGVWLITRLFASYRPATDPLPR
jgi:VIT1/CCC1 family predicted Fe2+/Mn2+ transporter